MKISPRIDLRKTNNKHGNNLAVILIFYSVFVFLVSLIRAITIVDQELTFFQKIKSISWDTLIGMACGLGILIGIAIIVGIIFVISSFNHNRYN